MRTAMRPRYYCDHCNKGNGSPSAMRRHERGCTLNPQPAERVPLTVPHPGSPEASAMIDSELAARGWPSNSKNAARAGYEACRKLIGADIKPLNAVVGVSPAA